MYLIYERPAGNLDTVQDVITMKLTLQLYVVVSRHDVLFCSVLLTQHVYRIFICTYDGFIF